MDASLAYFQARLATFDGPPMKSRRPSNRSKKAAPKSKAAWPMAAPSANDLAYAGFVFKPTSASPDNVQCWNCNCQLDGWEEADVPAYEHLTHSPSCGFAIITAIRLRYGDPARTEDDPTSDAMVTARKDTFSDLWPLDISAGYPSVDQLAAAGWFYDPAEGMPDGVTCAYCHLSLDAWDAGDDPMEEHRRRASDCLFFALQEMYHPAPESEVEQPKKTKRATKSKRTSARSSISSTTSTTNKSKRAAARTSNVSVATTAFKKGMRGRKRASEAVDNTQYSDAAPEEASIVTSSTKRGTRGRKRASEAVDHTQYSEAVPDDTSVLTTNTTATKKSTRGKKRTSDAMEDTQYLVAAPVQETTKKVAKKTTRGKKRASEAMDDTQFSQPVRPTSKRGKKRNSDAIEEPQFAEPAEQSPKRMRYSSISSLPDDLPVGTPKKMPSEMETEPFTMSSLPASLLVGTPKRTPPHLKEPEESRDAMVWRPADVEVLLASHQDTRGFVNNILVDAGLDELSTSGTTSNEIQAAVLAGLTDAERAMKIEQWILYNAKRGEEKLRMACEQQIAAFDAEGNRALAMMEAIPTY